MTLLIVDGMSIMRALAGAAAHLDQGYAYSFMSQVNAAVKKFEVGGVAVCWEGGFEKRSALLPSYKSNRTYTPPLIQQERDKVKELLTALGAEQFVAPGHEADDMIALLANTLGDCVIMSGDKDMLQLVRPGVSVYQKVRGAGQKSKKELITIENFQEKTGWPSPRVLLLGHCALGDDVDCIPKLAGVGAGIIHAYHLGMDIPAGKAEKLRTFYADSPQYILNRKLISLLEVKELEFVRTPGQWSLEKISGLLHELGFASILAKFEEWIAPWEKARLDADISTV